ncbi:exported hypothetical protein [Candidatus Zixiibacteriota bacterium]|nr:exported hypothetical protein [candidate division Zixibacteria bacterium]
MISKNLLSFRKLLVLLSFFLFFSNCLSSDGKTFGITSFIPERFRDLEWKVRGEVNFNYNDAADFAEGNSSDRISSYKMNNWGSNSLFNLDSYFRYRSVTIPRYMTFTLSNYFSALFQKSHSSSEYYGVFDNYEKNISEDRRRTISAELQPTLDLGIYLTGDLFVSSIIAGFIDYSKSPARESNADAYGSDRDPSHNYTRIYRRVSRLRQDSDSKSYYLAVSLLPGFGRVYEGNYAATAEYIIDELRRQKLLLKEPSYEQMWELSNIIYQYRNLHAIDSRIHLIESLRSVTDFLIKQGILSDEGTANLLIIQDVWNYFPKYSRQFGLFIRGGLGLKASFQSGQDGQSREDRYYEDLVDFDSHSLDGYPLIQENNRYTFEHTIYKRTDIYSEFLFDYYRPLNLKWQFSANYRARYYLYSKMKNYSDKYDSEIGSVNYREDIDTYKENVEMTLYPSLLLIIDSRSACLQKINIYYSHWKLESNSRHRLDSLRQELLTKSAQNEVGLNLASTFNYRIAIPTTLVIGASYNIFWSFPFEGEHYHSSNFNFSIAVEHYIF